MAFYLPKSGAENLEKWVRLNLFCNRLAGKILKFVSDLSSLEVLQLCENNFTGGILANLDVVMTRRKIINVSTNRLTGVLPDNLCAGAQLQMFIALGNSMFGAVHPRWACRVPDVDPAR
jgi:hypothetical protein